MAGMRVRITYEPDPASVKTLADMVEKAGREGAALAASAQKSEQIKAERAVSKERKRIIKDTTATIEKEGRRLGKSLTDKTVKEWKRGQREMLRAGQAVFTELHREGKINNTQRLAEEAKLKRAVADRLYTELRAARTSGRVNRKNYQMLLASLPKAKNLTESVVSAADKLGKKFKYAAIMAGEIHTQTMGDIASAAARGDVTPLQRQQAEVDELERHWRGLVDIQRKYHGTGKVTGAAMARLGEQIRKTANGLIKARSALAGMDKQMTKAEKVAAKLDARLKKVADFRFRHLAGLGEQFTRGQISEQGLDVRRLIFLQRQYESLGRTLDRLRGKLAPADLARLQGQFAKVGAEVEQASRRLERYGVAQERVKGGAKSLGARLRGLRGMLTGLLFAIPGAAAAFALLRRAFSGLARETGAFDTQLGQVHTLIPVTARKIEDLQDQIQSLANRVAKSPTDITQGLYYVISAGVRDASDAMKVLTASAEVAAAGLASTENTVDAVTTVLNAYRIQAADAKVVTDLFFKTVEQGKLTFVDVADNIGIMVATAAQAKVPLKELLAALAALTAQGIRAPEAAISLERLIAAIVSPTPEMARAAKDLGIEWGAAALAAKGLYGVMDQVRERTEGNTEALNKLVGRVARVRRAAFPFIENLDKFRVTLGTMDESSGAATRALLKVNETLEAQWQIVKNRLFDAWEGFGQQLLRARNRLVGMLAPMDKVADLMERMRKAGLDTEMLETTMRRGDLIAERIGLRRQIAKHDPFLAASEDVHEMERAVKVLRIRYRGLTETAQDAADALARVQEQTGVRLHKIPAESQHVRHTAEQQKVLDANVRLNELLAEGEKFLDEKVSSAERLAEITRELVGPDPAKEEEDDPKLEAEKFEVATASFREMVGEWGRLTERVEGARLAMAVALRTATDKEGLRATGDALLKARDDLAVFEGALDRVASGGTGAVRRYGKLWERLRESSTFDIGGVRIEAAQIVSIMEGLTKSLVTATVGAARDPGDRGAQQRLKETREEMGRFLLQLKQDVGPTVFPSLLRLLKDVGEEFGVSRGEVRETMDELTRFGFIDAKLDTKSLDQWRRKLDEIDRLRKRQAKDREREQKEEADRIRRMAKAYGDVVGGASKLLEGLGLIGAESTKVLDGLGQMAAALGRIGALQKAAAPATDFIGPISAGIGGLGMLIGSIVSQGRLQDESRRRVRESMRRLRDAIDRLKDTLISDVSPGEVRAHEERVRAGIADSGSEINKGTRFTGGLSLGWFEENDPQWLESFRFLAEAAGLWEQIAEDGIITGEEIQAVLDAINKGFGVFPDTLRGDLEGLAWVLQMLGDGALDTAQKVERFLEILRKRAPGVAKALEGRSPKEVEETLRKWGETLASGDQTRIDALLSMLGISAADLKALVDAGLGLVDDGTVDQVSKGVQIARSITEIQAVEVIAWLEHIAMDLRAVKNKYLGAAAIRGLSESAANIPGVVVSRGPGGGETEKQRAGATHVTINIDGMTVDVPASEDTLDLIFGRLAEEMVRRGVWPDDLRGALGRL